MKIGDIFKEIFTGVKPETEYGTDEKEYLVFEKDALEYPSFSIEKCFTNIVYGNIKSKYILKEGDIIISLRPPFKASVVDYDIKDKLIIVKPNFAVLRSPLKEFSSIFIANYINYILIPNNYNSLNLNNIKEMEIPRLNVVKKMNLQRLIYMINLRDKFYSTVLENDEEIIKKAIARIVNE